MLPEPSFPLTILFMVLCLSFIVQMTYYLRFYLAVVLFRHSGPGNDTPPVSVIICARNEARNLKNHLPSILEQDYPEYEVIVVNDCSEDESDDVLGEFIARYPNLRISNIQKDPKFTHNKKFAQFIGIKAASNEILVFTDADCSPQSPYWLRRMTESFSDKVKFILGYGGYNYQKSLLNSYIRFETMFIAMQYFGMALKGMPYMGVGRNLAYRRSQFFAGRGFGEHNHVVSGDDDLFVNSRATGENTRVVFTHDSHTRSVPSSSVGEWVKQKQRHLTTARYYKLRDKILLFSEPLTRILFYLSFIILLSNAYFWQIALVVFAIRLLTTHIIVYHIQKKLCEKNLLALSLFFDIFSPIINGALYLGSIRNRGAVAGWK